MLAIYKPTAKDAEKARSILKDNGINTNVRKANTSIEIGRQCKPLNKETSLDIIRLLESNGFKLAYDTECIYALIEANLNDTMSFWVISK